MPWVKAEGWVDFEVALDDNYYLWTGKFYVGKEINYESSVVVYNYMI